MSVVSCGSKLTVTTPVFLAHREGHVAQALHQAVEDLRAQHGAAVIRQHENNGLVAEIFSEQVTCCPSSSVKGRSSGTCSIEPLVETNLLAESWAGTVCAETRPLQRTRSRSRAPKRRREAVAHAAHGSEHGIATRIVISVIGELLETCGRNSDAPESTRPLSLLAVGGVFADRKLTDQRLHRTAGSGYARTLSLSSLHKGRADPPGPTLSRRHSRVQFRRDGRPVPTGALPAIRWTDAPPAETPIPGEWRGGAVSARKNK